MYIVKTIISGVGETLFLRYNLLGDAMVVYGKMKQRQLWTEAATELKPATEEFIDDWGVMAMVPAFGIMFTQLLSLDKFTEGDARQNIKAQFALQKEANRVQNTLPIVQPQPNGNFSRQ
jgi:hypothetical protein